MLSTNGIEHTFYVPDGLDVVALEVQGPKTILLVARAKNTCIYVVATYVHTHCGKQQM